MTHVAGIQTEYRTTDGKLYALKPIAEKHQFDLDYKPEIWWTPNNLRCEAQYDNHELNAKPMTTHELARLLLDHPELMLKTHEGMKVDRVTTRAEFGVAYAILGEALPK
jgi:hypothetical protein